MDVKERKKLALVYKIIMLEPNLAIFRQLKNIEYFENVLWSNTLIQLTQTNPE